MLQNTNVLPQKLILSLQGSDDLVEIPDVYLLLGLKWVNE